MLQALIGVAFSVGFIVGPLIGAYFSQQAHLVANVSDMFFTSPALFALTLATLNIIFLSFCLQETLPSDKRVSDGCVIVNVFINLMIYSLLCLDSIGWACV